MPYIDGVYPGVVTSVVGGAGGRVWVEHPGEKEMFWVERHLLYASHASTLTHWEQPRAAAASKKASKAKKTPNPKPDADPPAEPAPKPAKPDPKPEAKQALQPQPKAAPEAAPMEVDAAAHPLAKPLDQPPTQTRAQVPDGGETQATPPPPPFGRIRQAPALRFRAARTSKDKGQRKAVKQCWGQNRLKIELFLCACASVHKTCS